MKFLEYFERSESSKKAVKLLFILGDDVLLKDIIYKEYLRCVGVHRERVEIQDIRDLVSLLGEGSFFGSRFFDVIIKSKYKNTSSWSQLGDSVSQSTHFTSVRFESDLKQPSELVTKSHFISTVDCRFPKTNKEKIRFFDYRFKAHGVKLGQETLKEIAPKIRTSADLETVSLTLGLLARSGLQITSKDINSMVGETELITVSSRDLLNGNMVRLAEEISHLEPLFLLSAWHGILKRLYCWICQTSSSDYQEPSGEEEDEEEESQTEVKVKKVNKYHMKEFKIAKERYSLLLVREVMEGLNSIYQDIRLGRDENWQERTRILIQKLSLKS